MAWDAESAYQRARVACEYVARVLPPGAALQAIGRADRAVLEAETRQDWSAYVEALRELCKTARDEGRRAA
jgi:hypothetical protein